MEVFTPVEKFEQAHAVGGVVVPGAGVGGAVDERADGLLPLEALVDVVAFEVVAAGETEEGGMHGGELLHEVDAVAVGGVLVGGREERDEREPGGAGVLDGELEMVVGGGVRAPVLRVKSYCFQSVVRAGTVAEAAVAPVLSLTRRMVMGPRSALSDLA